jgi:hypothetical protein
MASERGRQREGLAANRELLAAEQARRREAVLGLKGSMAAVRADVARQAELAAVLQRQRRELHEREFGALVEAGMNPYEVFRRRDLQEQVGSCAGRGLRGLRWGGERRGGSRVGRAPGRGPEAGGPAGPLARDPEAGGVPVRHWRRGAPVSAAACRVASRPPPPPDRWDPLLPPVGRQFGRVLRPAASRSPPPDT